MFGWVRSLHKHIRQQHLRQLHDRQLEINRLAEDNRLYRERYLVMIDEQIPYKRDQ